MICSFYTSVVEGNILPYLKIIKEYFASTRTVYEEQSVVKLEKSGLLSCHEYSSVLFSSVLTNFNFGIMFAFIDEITV